MPVYKTCFIIFIFNKPFYPYPEAILAHRAEKQLRIILIYTFSLKKLNLVMPLNGLNIKWHLWTARIR